MDKPAGLHLESSLENLFLLIPNGVIGPAGFRVYGVGQIAEAIPYRDIQALRIDRDPDILFGPPDESGRTVAVVGG
jgi:hypothetical protein